MSELLAEAELKMTILIIVHKPFEVPEVLRRPPFRAGPQQDELGTVGDRMEQGMADEMHAFLGVQTADEAE